MQTLIDSTGPFQLPTHWGEVTTAQFCAVDPLPTAEARASYFAGRPIQVNGLVADALAWMLSAPPLGGGLPYPQDLGQESYLQVETIRTLLTTQPLHECVGAVYGTFVARDSYSRDTQAFDPTVADRRAKRCQPWPITDTWPAVAHCLAELQRLATKYAELSEPDPTEAARRAKEAGADELLGIFGHFNVARALAERSGRTIDEVYALPFETVCVYLLHDRRTAILSDTIQRNASKAHE